MIKKIILISCLLACCLRADTEPAPAPTPESVKALTQKVAHWQIDTFEQQHEYRALSKHILGLEKPPRAYFKKWGDRLWHNAALYVGMSEWWQMSGDEKTLNFLKKIGNRNKWKPARRIYHADDYAVGMMYLDLYSEFEDPAMIGPTSERLKTIFENPKTGSIKMKKGTDFYDRWGWCDALFMAPPVWARYAKLTGNKEYLEFMDQEYRFVTDVLWSEEHSLYFRDTRFFKRKEKNGERIFWSRGNGWVFGGLAVMIPDLPEDWESRGYYIDIFKKMANKLESLQRADGTWSMGLLGSLEHYPEMESSGTSFFAFGLAWGINAGLLDRERFEPVVLRAWAALEKCVQPDGLLGYVQPVGAAPGEVYPDKSEVYGVGAFLAAGTEIAKMLESTK